MPVKCLVDTGAAFCQFPTSLLAGLGVTPDRHVSVLLADGATRQQPAAWVEIDYGTLTAFTLALFGGENGLALLGAHALEGLGLAVDPVRRVLEPRASHSRSLARGTRAGQLASGSQALRGLLIR